MGHNKKAEHYDALSAQAQAYLENSLAKMRAEANATLSKHLTDSAKELISLTKFEGADSNEIGSARVRLDAIGRHLKILGVEIDQSKIDHNITITVEQAGRIKQARELMEVGR